MKPQPEILSKSDLVRIAVYQKKATEYKKCAAGKPVNCDKCIGCKGK